MSAPVTKCHNCDFEENDLAAVHRVYVTPEAWDMDPSIRVDTDLEWWCVSCLTQYPSEPAEELLQ